MTLHSRVWTRALGLTLAVTLLASTTGAAEVDRYLPADTELIRGAVSKVSFPAWAEVCDKSNPGCSQKWMASVGAPVLGLK